MGMQTRPIGLAIERLHSSAGTFMDTVSGAANELRAAGDRVKLVEFGAVGSGNFHAWIGRMDAGAHHQHSSGGARILASELGPARAELLGAIHDVTVGVDSVYSGARTELAELAGLAEGQTFQAARRAARDADEFADIAGGVKQRLAWGERTEPAHGFFGDHPLPQLALEHRGGHLTNVAGDTYTSAAHLGALEADAVVARMAEHLRGVTDSLPPR